MAGPRRILYLIDIYAGPTGGTEGQLAALIESLPRDWEPRMWVLQSSGYLQRHAFPCPTRELRLPRMRHPLFVPRFLALAGAIRSERIDLVHGFHADTCTFAPLLGALAGVPVITSRRDLGYWQTPRKLEALRRANRYADAILANADAVAARTVAVEHALPSQVHVIRNGHDPARFDVAPDADVRARLGIPEDAPLIGLTANFRPLKRQTDLVEALARLGRRAGEAHVLFIGDGSPRAVEERAEALGVAERVHVIALERDVVPVLKQLTVGALCSESEGLSNAVLEYMGCGLPVVATDVGGNPELVTHGENGLLYAPGAVPALAEALTHVLADPELAARLGRASRARFEANHGLERMVDRTVGRYEAVLRGRRRRPAPTGLRAELVSDVEALAALVPEWETLLAPERFFQSPAWVLTWLRWSGARPCVAVVRSDAGALVGLLPLAWDGDTLVFCGQALGADHLDVVAAAGREDDVARLALEALGAERWRALRLAHVSEDGALRRVLRETDRYPYAERLATVCRHLAVGDAWPVYVGAQFSGKTAKRLRRWRADFEARAGARVERIVEPGACKAAVDRLFALHAERSAAGGRRSSFEGESLRAFHAALTQRLAEEGRLRLSFLVAEGRDLAVEYGFRLGTKVYGFQSGMAPDERTPYPGVVLLAITLAEDVFGHGVRDYDFLDGDEPYKRRWATGVRRLYDLTVYPPTRAGRARARARGALAVLKAEVKRRVGRR